MESFLNLKIVENNFELDQILIENSQLKEKNTILLAYIILVGVFAVGLLIYFKELIFLNVHLIKHLTYSFFPMLHLNLLLY